MRIARADQGGRVAHLRSGKIQHTVIHRCDYRGCTSTIAMTFPKDHNLTAMQRVLENPDLLLLIFDTCLHEESKHKGESLAIAACVNHTWFAVATSVLWGQLSYPFHEDITHILTTFPQSRRQHYASRMRLLKINERRAASMHASFKGTNFPLLKNLELALTCQIHDQQAGSIALYLQPALESLTVHDEGDYLDDDFVAHVTKNCPHLKAVLFASPGTHLSVQVLSDLFAASKNLEEASLRFKDFGRLISMDPLLQLSKLQKLRILQLISPPASSVIFSFVNLYNSHPFQALRKLTLYADTSTVSTAARLFANVQELSLSVHGADSSFLRNVASMENLTTLVVQITGELTFEVDDMIALTSLQHLENLVFSSDSHLHPTSFTPSEFDHFCSCLPSILHLDLEACLISCPMEFLISLSNHCPKLDYLNLYNAACNFETLVEVPGPLFPNLKTLILNAVQPEDVTEELAIMIGGAIHWHANSLEHLNLGDSRFADFVEEVWEDARSE
ncbi:hypothetical protein E4T43_00495 [Aureobasidium subglaciale]|nr:hypothetical protein E4T43_00495 [Aureobasidium subglaciale]